jgi:hypothetical protein
MANPNLINVAAIFGENSLTSLSTTSATSILSNAASSNKIYKVNSIIVSNVDGTTPADITISVYSAAALGGTAFPIVSTLSVPADSSVIVVDKSTGIYIKENQSIGATAGTANDLVVVASWEEINS